MNYLELICQIAIPVFSGASIWCFADKRYRLGFILGLSSEPFWFYSTYTQGLWGMFAVSFWFAGQYIVGIANHRSTKK